jgi:drug/metabolite transporter (DMT)-like permease
MNKNSNLTILIILGIIWSTFAILTKIPSEVLSPYFIAFSRLFIGALILLPVALLKKKRVFVIKNFKFYTIVGITNSALPFILFAYAAKPLDSGIVAILDGTVPMFEVLISVFILGRAVDKNAIWGVIFGIIGVIVTSFGDGLNIENASKHSDSIFLTLTATCSYAVASLYINAKCKHIDAMTLATGSVMCAGILLVPSLFFADFSLITPKIGLSLLGLGTLCTGIAYIFYFKLTAEESPRTAVSVVLLIPVFGTILGTVFLGEVLSLNKIIGCMTILVSMKFILNLSRKNFFKSKELPIA